jgi:hypothetical protein
METIRLGKIHFELRIGRHYLCTAFVSLGIVGPKGSPMGIRFSHSGSNKNSNGSLIYLPPRGRKIFCSAHLRSSRRYLQPYRSKGTVNTVNRPQNIFGMLCSESAGGNVLGPEPRTGVSLPRIPRMDTDEGMNQFAEIIFLSVTIRAIRGSYLRSVVSVQRAYSQSKSLNRLR